MDSRLFPPLLLICFCSQNLSGLYQSSVEDSRAFDRLILFAARLSPLQYNVSPVRILGFGPDLSLNSQHSEFIASCSIPWASEPVPLFLVLLRHVAKRILEALEFRFHFMKK